MNNNALLRAALAACIAAFVGGSMAGSGTTHAQTAGPNLLKNPGFDWPAQTNGDMCAPGWVKGNAITPHDWTPYWTCKNDTEKNQDQINRSPEYRVMTLDIAKDRVHGGDTSASFFTFWALNRSMGLYQRVGGIAQGTRLRFSIWVNLLTTDSDVLPLNSSRSPGGLQARACIHTTSTFGLAPNLNDPAVICGPWARPYDTWGEVSVEATANSQANEVAVIVDTSADYPVKHNDVHVDDASLTVIGGASAAPVAVAAAPPQVVAQPTPAPAAPAAAPANDSTPRVIVKGDIANVRSAPSFTSPILASAPQGTSFAIRAYTADKEWFQIEYSGGQNGTAYVHSSVVALNAAAQTALGTVAQPVPQPAQPTTAPPPVAQSAAPAATGPAQVTVSTGGGRLIIRATPAATGKVLGRVANGTSLAVIGVSPDKQWWHITYPGAADGTAWAMAQWVTPNVAAKVLLGS